MTKVAVPERQGESGPAVAAGCPRSSQLLADAARLLGHDVAELISAF
ncbi:hypothetical protein BH18VER2_BH18VER2_02680 [soil metagenome]